MKRMILIMFIVFIASLAQGERRGVLTDVLKPDAIEIARERLYVLEGATCLVYSLKNLELIGKFGRKGEGPGELTVVPMYPNNISAIDDKLVAQGLNKLILFSKDFKLVKELKKKDIWMFKVTPVGENFVAIQTISGKDKKNYISVSLFDPELKVIKNLFKQEHPGKQNLMYMVRDSIHFAVYKDKIYIEESEKGFVVEVFDSKGNTLYEIKKNVEKCKVTEKDKKALLENFKKDSLFALIIKEAGGWENYKKTINFFYPDTFPFIQDIIVTDDKIYVSTYKSRENKEQFIIMDLEGNILSTPYLPIPQKSAFTASALGRDNRFYGFANNKYYYLKENEDTENWEIHETEIGPPCHGATRTRGTSAKAFY